MDTQDNIVIKTKTEFAKKITFLTAFFLLMIILPVGFVDEKSARVAFYLCGYTSLLGLLLDYRNIRTFILDNKLCCPFIVLSILFFTWSVIYKFHEYPHEADGTLFTPAKRWLFSYIISIFLISNFKFQISNFKFQGKYIRQEELRQTGINFLIFIIHYIRQLRNLAKV